MLLTSIALLLSAALLLFVAARGSLFALAPGEDRSVGRTRFLMTLFRLAMFVAIAASAALVVDYKNAGDPAFCGVSSGCFAVRVSPYSRPLGVPLPNLGLAAFTSLLAASLVVRERSHLRIVAGAAGAGAAVGVVLLGLQAFAVHAFCPWCVAVDTSAIVAGVAAVLAARQAGRADPQAFDRAVRGPATTLVWCFAALAAVGVPFLWAQYPVIPPLPTDIAAMQVPGKITVVGFTDFQCPFCRKLHPEIEKAEQEYGDRLHYVRKMMPLPSHPGALPAAQAYLASPEPLRERAAALLYTAPPEALTELGIPKLLAPAGVDPAALTTRMASRAIKAALDADIAIYDRLEGRGLPFTYVGRRLVIGYNPERLWDALRREASGDQLSLPLSGMFAVLVVVAGVAAAVNARASR